MRAGPGDGWLLCQPQWKDTGRDGGSRHHRCLVHLVVCFLLLLSPEVTQTVWSLLSHCTNIKKEQWHSGETHLLAEPQEADGVARSNQAAGTIQTTWPVETRGYDLHIQHVCIADTAFAHVLEINHNFIDQEMKNWINPRSSSHFWSMASAPSAGWCFIWLRRM